MIIHTTTKGQIVIPTALRCKYGITETTIILIIDNGDEIILRPMTQERIAKLRGSLNGKGSVELFLEERRKDKEKEDAGC
jgi:AbrB family looped-hinge helix DNA binding protein